jgi:hypothetical protein
MNSNLTFIIPVRHPDNSKNWSSLVEKLSQTIRSIAAQNSNEWRAVIVANQSASLPELPPGFDVVRVDFDPNPNYEFNTESLEVVYESVRLDKGRRVLSGMLHARDSRFFMVVDDDDFVNHDIASFVASNLDNDGWKIKEGYVWGDGGNLLIVNKDFYNFCGTSLIIRSDHYKLPNNITEASDAYIKEMLGSHVKIDKILSNRGINLNILPFKGAVYRIGHSGAHSKSPSILRKYFFNRNSLLDPKIIISNFLKLRFLNKKIKSSFFGT